MATALVTAATTNATWPAVSLAGPCVLSMQGGSSGGRINFDYSADGGATWEPLAGVFVGDQQKQIRAELEGAYQLRAVTTGLGANASVTVYANQ